MAERLFFSVGAWVEEGEMLGALGDGPSKDESRRIKGRHQSMCVVAVGVSSSLSCERECTGRRGGSLGRGMGQFGQPIRKEGRRKIRVEKIDGLGPCDLRKKTKTFG